jgi:Ice-binding-like
MFTRPLRRWSAGVMAVSTGAALLVLGAAVASPAASAAQPPVGMGTAAPFAVLAGSTITNTGPSVISGSIGLDPGTAITGFPPGTQTNGTTYAADAVALQAQNDLTTAYNQAAGATPVTVESADLGGQTLAPGVYKGTSTMSLTGTVTLNGENNPNSVFIFQAGSTLTTASSSVVALVNGATWCNVFWQVGSSATLGTATTFVGTIMALTSDTLTTGATVMGRVLARNGAVTLDTNTITQPACATSTTTATTAAPGGGGGGATGTTPTPKAKSPTGNGLGGGGVGSGIVPTGFPATGLGGASRSDDPALVALGGVALVGAVLALAQGFRRRRLQPLGNRSDTDDGPDGDA